MVPTLAASDLIAEVKSRKGDSAIRIPTARRTSFIRWSLLSTVINTDDAPQSIRCRHPR